jgi:GDSL-like Lipase/Acylhydrolase family
MPNEPITHTRMRHARVQLRFSATTRSAETHATTIAATTSERAKCAPSGIGLRVGHGMERVPCARAATGTMNRSRRARRFTLLLVPMVIGAYAGIAAATTAPSTGNTRATAVFLGDSNEVLSGTDLAVSLLNRDNGYIVVEVARPGATIRFGDCTQRTTCPTYDYWQSRVVDTLAAVRPDVWVVDLGINDASRPGTPTSPGYSNYGAKIDWLMNLLGSTPVVWTNLPCKIEPSALRAGCKLINQALAAARTRHANLSVLTWASKANPHPKYLGPPYGVHLTTAGRSAWTGLVTERLDSMFTAP